MRSPIRIVACSSRLALVFPYFCALPGFIVDPSCLASCFCGLMSPTPHASVPGTIFSLELFPASADFRLEDVFLGQNDFLISPPLKTCQLHFGTIARKYQHRALICHRLALPIDWITVIQGRGVHVGPSTSRFLTSLVEKLFPVVISPPFWVSVKLGSLIRSLASPPISSAEMVDSFFQPTPLILSTSTRRSHSPPLSADGEMFPSAFRLCSPPFAPRLPAPIFPLLP